ncbi:unnamed protein product [Cylicocyclus nassatus]|uniref:Uncharacterized protein n=1 Tax=Cylicocyclus nassatus TaxID=53992 RepID=A0AA36DSJ3_CYLNA|nr:unnamed protein product [Cylicocyclus nassatus]
MFGLVAAITIIPTFAQVAHKCDGSVNDTDREDLKTTIYNYLVNASSTTDFPYYYSCTYEYCVYNPENCTEILQGEKVINSSVSFFTPPGGEGDVRKAAKTIFDQLRRYLEFKNVTWGCDLKNDTEISEQKIRKEQKEQKLRNGNCFFTPTLLAYSLALEKKQYNG